ncbi:MAG: hypothetical protein JSW47_12955 [Phycisphaerales bacterium]|nr:MAG: hypothetical protein JSW47_12955 [Phycisphaerales bacterium]
MKTQISRIASKTTEIVIMIVLTVIIRNSRTIGAPGRDRYLLLDSRIVDTTENARLTLGKTQKSKHNPLFAEDEPWEKRFDNLYANVIYEKEDKLYKYWYSPFIVDKSALGITREWGDAFGRQVARTSSADFVNWSKSEVVLEGLNPALYFWKTRFTYTTAAATVITSAGGMASSVWRC